MSWFFRIRAIASVIFRGGEGCSDLQAKWVCHPLHGQISTFLFRGKCHARKPPPPLPRAPQNISDFNTLVVCCRAVSATHRSRCLLLARQKFRIINLHHRLLTPPPPSTFLAKDHRQFDMLDHGSLPLFYGCLSYPILLIGVSFLAPSLYTLYSLTSFSFFLWLANISFLRRITLAIFVHKRNVCSANNSAKQSN